MNLQFYIEKLHSSEVFKKFKKENPKAYFCSGFFTIDEEGKDNQAHLDFFIPESKKIVSFDLKGRNGVEIRPEQSIGKFKEDFTITKISNPKKINFNFEKLETLITNEMKKKGIKNKIQKILISLQNFKEKNILFCTVFITGFGLLKASIELDTFKIKEFKKKSLFDLIKKG